MLYMKEKNLRFEGNYIFSVPESLGRLLCVMRTGHCLVMYFCSTRDENLNLIENLKPVLGYSDLG